MVNVFRVQIGGVYDTALGTFFALATQLVSVDLADSGQDLLPLTRRQSAKQYVGQIIAMFHGIEPSPESPQGAQLCR